LLIKTVRVPALFSPRPPSASHCRQQTFDLRDRMMSEILGHLGDDLGFGFLVNLCRRSPRIFGGATITSWLNPPDRARRKRLERRPRRRPRADPEPPARLRHAIRQSPFIGIGSSSNEHDKRRQSASQNSQSKPMRNRGQKTWRFVLVSLHLSSCSGRNERRYRFVLAVEGTKFRLRGFVFEAS
jgi:hypothetical protein